MEKKRAEQNQSYKDLEFQCVLQSISRQSGLYSCTHAAEKSSICDSTVCSVCWDFQMWFSQLWYLFLEQKNWEIYVIGSGTRPEN